MRFQTLEDGLIFASPSNGYLIPSEKHRINIGFQKIKRSSYEIPIIVERIPKKAFGILLGFHSAGITEKRRGIQLGFHMKKKLKPSDSKWDSCSQMGIYTSLVRCPIFAKLYWKNR